MPNRPSIPKKVKNRVRIEAGHRCAVCGEVGALEFAHIVPWSRTQDHSAENIICLCATCHSLADNENWGDDVLREHKQNPWIHKHTAEPTPAVPVSPERRELLSLGNVVKDWVQDLLESSVPEERRIALVLEERSDAVELPAAARKRALETPSILSVEKLLDLFKDSKPSLLILGETGSGKTTTLLQLAKGLLAVARKSGAEEPIPVYLSLSSWAESQLPLDKWLVEAIGDLYKAGDMARRFCPNRILPLLDGLDEVEAGCQAACVKIINDWLHDYGIYGMAVCCHTRVYEELPQLQLAAAVVLQPLTEGQIKEYAARTGPAGERLREVLAGDEGLRELAETPQLLNLIEEFCKDDSGTRTLAESAGAPLGDRGRTLLKNYVDDKLNKSSLPPSPYPPEQTLRSLAWLAKQMKDHSSSLFQLEQLQPSWLPRLAERWAYFILTRAIAGALLIFPLALILWRPALMTFGTIAGVLVGIFDAGTELRRQGSATQPGGAWQGLVLLSATIAFPPLFLGAKLEQVGCGAFLFGALATLLFGLVLGLRNAKRTGNHDIQVAETLTWSRVSWRGALIGGSAGVLIAGILWLVLLLQEQGTSVLAVAQAAGLLLLAGAMAGGILGGVQTGTIPKKSRPNLGMSLTLQNSKVLFLAVFWGISLVGGAVVLALHWLWPETQYSIPLWLPLFLGSLLGLAVALGFSGLDFLQHFVLRALLCLRGYAPARYVDFLDYAADCGLLHKAGGSYLFRYGRPLLKHFASLFSPTREEANSTACRRVSA